MENNNNKNNFDNTIKELNKLYDNLSYFDLYGENFFVFLVLTIIVFFSHIYAVTMSNAGEIKNDWINQRCNPKVIPFAGFINKPENSTILQFTNDNFQYCIQDILKNISGYALEPFGYITSALTEVYNDINNSVNAIRQFIGNLRDDVSNVVHDIMSRIMNIMTPLQIILISIKDSFGKIQGILTTSLMTALGGYLTLQTLMGAILQFMVLILITLATVIVALWASLFSFPLAASLTIAFLAISIPLSIIIIFMKDVLKVHTTKSIPKVPKKPKSCFDEDTIIFLNDGTTKKISEIVTGDILKNNNKVKATLKLDSKNELMFNLCNIVVSGTHIVKYKNKWINVSEHPLSKKIVNYKKPYLYCINTENKTININDLVFCDWDEIYGNFIGCVLGKKLFNGKKIKNLKDINKYLDCGFSDNTKIVLKNEKTKCIKDIEIGDVLYNGEIVYGLVKIEMTDNGFNKNKKFNYCFKDFSSENKFFNLCGIFKYLEEQFITPKNINHKHKKLSYHLLKNKYSYHLLTDKGTFKTQHNNYFDYNYSVDNLIILF